jgi:hypothetical protein
MIGRLKCWWKGKHARGKLLMVVNTAERPEKHYRCPRCGAKWVRYGK